MCSESVVNPCKKRGSPGGRRVGSGVSRETLSFLERDAASLIHIVKLKANPTLSLPGSLAQNDLAEMRSPTHRNAVTSGNYSPETQICAHSDGRPVRRGPVNLGSKTLQIHSLAIKLPARSSSIITATTLHISGARVGASSETSRVLFGISPVSHHRPNPR